MQKFLDKEGLQYFYKKLKAEQPAYTFGHGFKIEENGDKKVVEINTVSDFEGDKSLPITASGVEIIVGNIESLLKII